MYRIERGIKTYKHFSGTNYYTLHFNFCIKMWYTSILTRFYFFFEYKTRHDYLERNDGQFKQNNWEDTG